MEKLITASGRVFECGYYSKISDPSRLYIRIANATIGDIATAFSSASETAKLTISGVTFDGFTKLLAIVPEDNLVRVTLTKE